MKKILKGISEIAIIAFGVLVISRNFIDLGAVNSPDLTNILIVVYLISNFYYYRMLVKEKNNTIRKLEQKIKELTKNQSI